MKWLSDSEQVELLAVKFNHLSRFSRMMDEIDPTDWLILATILDDAGAHPSPVKVILTKNHRCFHDNRTVRQSLQDGGIEKYFASAENFLQWYEARAES